MNGTILAHVATNPAHQFVTVPNSFARAEHLPDDSKMLLIELMSHIETWSTSERRLVNERRSRKLVRRMLGDLERARHVVRLRIKGQGQRRMAFLSWEPMTAEALRAEIERRQKILGLELEAWEGFPDQDESERTPTNQDESERYPQGTILDEGGMVPSGYQGGTLRVPGMVPSGYQGGTLRVPVRRTREEEQEEHQEQAGRPAGPRESVRSILAAFGEYDRPASVLLCEALLQDVEAASIPDPAEFVLSRIYDIAARARRASAEKIASMIRQDIERGDHAAWCASHQEPNPSPAEVPQEPNPSTPEVPQEPNPYHEVELPPGELSDGSYEMTPPPRPGSSPWRGKSSKIGPAPYETFGGDIAQAVAALAQGES